MCSRRVVTKHMQLHVFEYTRRDESGESSRIILRRAIYTQMRMANDDVENARHDILA